MYPLVYSFLLFFSQLSFSKADIPNSLIVENPNSPISTVESIRRKEKGELNLNIRKISSVPIEGFIDTVSDEIYFILDSIKSDESISVTTNLNKFKEISSSMESLSNGKKKIISEYRSNLPNIYLIKYNKNTKDIVTLYKWNKKTNYMANIKGNIEITFKDNYLSYETVLLSDSFKNDKVDVTSPQGSPVKLDIDTKYVEVKDIDGTILERINIVSGNGSKGMGDSNTGITLREGNNTLVTGLGFKNGNLQLKLKSWTEKERYSFILKSFGDKGIHEYKVTLIPPEYKFKILSKPKNLNFGKIDRNTRAKTGTLEEMLIEVPNKNTKINISLEDNGILKMKNKNGDTIAAKVDVEIHSDNNSNGLKKISVQGTIEEDLRHKSEGDYEGSIEMTIEIDA